MYRIYNINSNNVCGAVKNGFKPQYIFTAAYDNIGIERYDKRIFGGEKKA